MTLEQQVCSLELAKRLKELGVKQESVFSWRVPTGRDKVPKPLADEEIRLVYLWHEYQKELWDTYSAFTVAELSGILPWLITRDNEEWYLMIEKDQNNDGSDCWRAFYETLNDGQRCCKSDGTLADSLASLAVHLLENKLITV